MDKNSIIISEQTLSDGRKKIAETLKNTKATDKERTLAQLLAEENFFRLKHGMSAGVDFSAEITVRTRLGSTELIMTAKGAEYNPIPTMTDEAEGDAENAYRLAILKSNRARLHYIRKGDTNVVVIKVRGLEAEKKQIIYTVSGLILGSLCGLLMQATLDASALKLIDDIVVNPIRGLFLNALHMMMAPVTFFAIIAGVTNISDAALIGKLGGKMVIVSFFMQIITATFALGLGIMIFSDDISYMQAGIASPGEAAVSSEGVSMKDMLLGIIPTNLIDPFKGDNILQVMFLAIFFGIILNKMGEQAKGVTEVIDFLFRFMINVLQLIVKVIPFIVFLSMAILLASTGIDSIITFSGLFIGLFISIFSVWAIGAFTIAIFGKINPFFFTKKFAVLSPLVFSVSSSHARLPFVLKFCADKLGIDAKLAAFSVPVGVQLNKAGSCTFFSLSTLMLMKVYNIEVSLSVFLTLWVSVIIMAIAKPPIPCGGIICIAYLFAVVGVPPEAISVILCVEPIATMFNGVCNESSNLTTTFILARGNGMLDEKKYFAS